MLPLSYPKKEKELLTIVSDTTPDNDTPFKKLLKTL